MKIPQKITESTYEGKTFAEITASLGEPFRTVSSPNVTLRLWQDAERYLILIFTPDDVCFCLFDEGVLAR